MRTSAMAPAFAATTIATNTPKIRSSTNRVDKPTLFSRLFKAMTAAQELRARRVVNAHLALHDDAALKRLGWQPADIARLRADVSGGRVHTGL
jgi:hypothetical protein